MKLLYRACTPLLCHKALSVTKRNNKRGLLFKTQRTNVRSLPLSLVGDAVGNYNMLHTRSL